MSATRTKGIKFDLSGPVSGFVSKTPTTITKADPAVVTIASVAGMAAGDIIKVPSSGTGFTELDGKYFVAGVVNTGPNTLTLLGSKTAASTGTLSATPSILHSPAADVNAMTCTFSEFTINSETPGNISTATYCDPSAQIPSTVVAAGTASFKGFVDVTASGYQNLLSAVEDGEERVIRITLPNNGYLVAPCYVASIGWEVPLDGVIAFNGQLTLSSRFSNLY